MTIERIEDLESLTGSQLVAHHNALAEKTGANDLKSWKKAKKELVKIVAEMQDQVLPLPKRERTIREASIEWLCHVAFHEDRNEKPGTVIVEADHKNARTVGLPYAEIIDHLMEEFPDAKTSVECLRWYAVKMRAEEQGYEGHRLPQRRPRATPKKS